MMSAIFFYILAALILVFAYKTITANNPIHCALYLAITMVNLAFMFFGLNAPFIGGVQLVVYAGAVMVLFVMVLMLFDLKAEIRAFSRGLFSGLLKIASAGLMFGILSNAIFKTGDLLGLASSGSGMPDPAGSTQDLAILLFTDYLFAFEVLGLLLLLVAVGAVAVSRIKGGTHAS